MSESASQGSFVEEVRRLAICQTQRDATTLVPQAGRMVWDVSIDIIGQIVFYTYWFECDSEQQKNADERYQAFRLANLPNTLSGDILRLKRNLPELDIKYDYEIVGDEIHQLTSHIPLSNIVDDNEEVGDVVASLPEVQIDLSRHFVKKSKYKSEVQNLLLCQGGSCPGVPKSAHIIQLLGKSPKNELVFEKLNPRYVLADTHPLSTYKSWILQVIDGLRCLHSLGIVHHDLRIDNLVFSSDNSKVIICRESLGRSTGA